MRCPTCNHQKTRIIRTRPDPEFDSTDLVRQCKNPGCLSVFTSRESVISVIENSQDQHILLELVSRIQKLHPNVRDHLMKLIQVG